MKMTLLISALVAATGVSAIADSPTLGGPMSHLLVTLFQNEIYITFESPSMSDVDMQDNTGDFSGSSSILNNTGYNAQFGWLVNGFISLPPSTGIFVRTTSISEYLSVYEEGSFESILGTDDSNETWQWDGTMTHNWYATDVHGPHFASYEVFVGDLAGNPLDGFTSGFVDLSFQYGPDLSGRVGTHSVSNLGTVPTPGALGVFALASLVSCKRRR